MFQSILSQQPDLKFIPFISVFFFFVDLSDRKSQKDSESMLLFFLAANSCTHRGPIISAKSKEAAHYGRFGALGTKNLIQRWRVEGMVGFFSRFSSILQG